MVIKDELEKLLNLLRTIDGPIHVSKKKQFLSIIRGYQKLNNPSEVIQKMMYEAKSYFE